MLMDEHLGRMAVAFPDETAFAVVDVGALTFAEWDGAANALARRLVGEGIAPGDRVGIHLHPELALCWLVSYAAIHRAGGVAVPMNPRLAPAEVGHVLSHAGAAAVVADGELVAADAEVGQATLRMVVDASSGPTADHADPALRRLAFADATAGDASPFQVPRASNDLADILYTSGTTGRPKGVAVRHSNASMIGAVEPNWTGGGWVHSSPLFTFAGISLVYTPMKLGLKVIYQPRFDADRWLRLVEEERPISVFLVPAMAHLLIDHPRFDLADLSSVELCSVGSAPLAPYVLERLQDKMPDALVSNNYGMTEAGSAYAIMPKGEAVKRPGSVGQIVPPAIVKIVDEHECRRARRPGRRGPPAVARAPSRVLRRSRGDSRDVEGRMARHRRPGPARRGRVPLRRRPLQGRDHPRRQQRARHGRRARHRPAPCRQGGRRRRGAAPRARRGRRRLRRPASRPTPKPMPMPMRCVRSRWANSRTTRSPAGGSSSTPFPATRPARWSSRR